MTFRELPVLGFAFALVGAALIASTAAVTAFAGTELVRNLIMYALSIGGLGYIAVVWALGLRSEQRCVAKLHQDLESILEVEAGEPRVAFDSSSSESLGESSAAAIVALPHHAPAVFVSYSSSDRGWGDSFRKMLAPSVRIWSDEPMHEGENWRAKLSEALERCDAAVLLVTPELLNSPFVRDVELPLFQRFAELGGKRVFCVAVKSTPEPRFLGERFWHAKRTKWVNTPARPLAQLTSAQRAKEIHNICTEIVSVLKSRSR